MKDVIIIEAFEGYPDGKTARMFQPSPDAISVPNDFADLIVGKGHARWPKGDVKRKPSRKPQAKKPTPSAPSAGPATAQSTPPAPKPAPDIPPAPNERADEGEDA